MERTFREMQLENTRCEMPIRDALNVSAITCQKLETWNRQNKSTVMQVQLKAFYWTYNCSHISILSMDTHIIYRAAWCNTESRAILTFPCNRRSSLSRSGRTQPRWSWSTPGVLLYEKSYIWFRIWIYLWLRSLWYISVYVRFRMNIQM